ncbi:MAG: hypothetical protein SV422_15740, partial [Pseudomonadota bacterium]|nr:hypothetical protein [Pseudomonadota bacterium]
MTHILRSKTPALLLAFALVGCGGDATNESTSAAPEASASTAASANPVPRYDDGTVRLDRIPGENSGYWANPSQHSLIEKGVSVVMNEQGILGNIEDAAKVAPFMDWSLALYKYRQANRLKDDPVNVCISPAGPRHLHDPKG